MGSNEPPEETPGRTITIPLSPENLILAAAILFLLAAVVLAVFFSIDGSGSSNNGQPTSVAVGATGPAGMEATSQGGAQRATPGADQGGFYPAPSVSTPEGDSPLTQATLPSQPYPGPNESLPGQTSQPIPTVAAPTSDPEDLFSEETPEGDETGGEATANPTASGTGPTNTAGGQVPTFAPARPTATVAGSNNPYPGPGSPSGPGATAAPTSRPANPTSAPSQPAPTHRPATPRPATPQPTTEPAGGSDNPPAAATARPPQAPPTVVPPTPVPVDIIRGAMRWSANQSPVIVRRDLQIAPGSSLVIDPGVEVQLAPGVALYVDGKLYAAGEDGKPVRFTSTGGGRWDAIYGRPGGDIGLDRVEISGGGNGGTLISSEGGNLTVLRSRIRDNGGQIRTLDSRLEMRDTDVSGNDMPYGAAIDASYTNGGGVTLTGNRIGGNALAAGAPPVQVRNESGSETVNLDVQGNLMVGRNGPDMVIFTNGPLRGGMSCNAWMNGTDGLMIKANTLQVAPEIALTVANNAIEDQTPPIIPVFLEYGIGRGATSDVYVDMRNNWWRSPLGPYHPDLHADGRGEAVGANITFEPWLTERPSCAPRP